MNPLLQVRDLTVTYCSQEGDRVTALDCLSLDIGEGEAVGLLGESGCGKTTLALSVPGLLPRTCTLRGSIIFRGVNLLQLEEGQLQKVRGAEISLVHQEPGTALNPVLRVGNQVAEVLRAHKTITRKDALREAAVLLAQVGLSEECRFSEAYPHQLSGGQKQRVVIAQAIACRPALLIADEPSTALDGITQSRLFALFKKLQSELQLALLLITHDPESLRQHVDRVLVMEAGRLVEQGVVEQVLDRPFHPYTRAVLGARPSGLRPRLCEQYPAEEGDRLRFVCR
jgi:ABC-type glutathione transport system ATPase component